MSKQMRNINKKLPHIITCYSRLVFDIITMLQVSELDTALELVRQEKDELINQVKDLKRQLEDMKRTVDKLNDDNNR